MHVHTYMCTFIYIYIQYIYKNAYRLQLYSVFSCDGGSRAAMAGEAMTYFLPGKDTALLLTEGTGCMRGHGAVTPLGEIVT